MHACAARAGLAGSRVAAESDLVDAVRPRRPAAGRTPRTVLCGSPRRLSLRRRYRQAVLPHGTRGARRGGLRAARQRRRGARRGVAAPAQRSVVEDARRRVAPPCAQRRRAAARAAATRAPAECAGRARITRARRRSCRPPWLPPLATSSMRRPAALGPPAGRRARPVVGRRFVSQCGTRTGRWCSRAARAAGGSEAAGQAGSGVEALVEASSRPRDDVSSRSRGEAWRRCAHGGSERGGRPRIGSACLGRAHPAHAAPLVWAAVRVM